MHEVKYAYAKNNQNVYVFINDITQNNRYEFYYLLSDKGEQIQMIPVINGERQKHFRTKSDGVAVGMSAEHLNLIAKLCNDKQFYCKDLDLPITAKRAEDEYELKDINRRVDVAYFDDNDDFLCGIEVVHTNDISDEKYIDIYNSNYLIFKVYTYDSERFIYVNNGKIDRESNEKAIARTAMADAERAERINTALSKYIIEWKNQMGKENINLSTEFRRIKMEYDSLKSEYEPVERIIDNYKKENRELEYIHNGLKEQICAMRHGFNKSANYFESLEEVRIALRETEGEEGELIRDIEQITKQINQFYITP